MFKTLEDIIGIPLEVTEAEVFSLINNERHQRDLQSVTTPEHKPRFIYSTTATGSISYYFVERGRLNGHAYSVSPEKLLALYNKKYKKENKLEVYVTRRKNV